MNAKNPILTGATEYRLRPLNDGTFAIDRYDRKLRVSRRIRTHDNRADAQEDLDILNEKDER